MLLDIHLLMQDADDINAEVGLFEKHEMRSGSIFEIAGTDIFGGAAFQTAACQRRHHVDDLGMVDVGLRWRPVLGGIKPDTFKVGTRAFGLSLYSLPLVGMACVHVGEERLIVERFR